MHLTSIVDGRLQRIEAKSKAVSTTVVSGSFVALVSVINGEQGIHRVAFGKSWLPLLNMPMFNLKLAQVKYLQKKEMGAVVPRSYFGMRAELDGLES